MKTVAEMAREVETEVGGFKWCVNFIELERFAALVRADERRTMMQLFIDPENQPTQHGTVTLEYMQREIAAEREACANVCEQGLAIATSLSALDDMEMWGEKFATAIRARSKEQHMTCKHRWEPSNINRKNRPPNHYLYQCTRCSGLIHALLKEKT